MRFFSFFVLILVTFPIDQSHSILPIIYDSSNKLHRDLKYHPEQPARIDACIDELKRFQHDKLGSIELQDVAENSAGAFREEELNHARDMLVQAHSESFVMALEQRCRNSRHQRIREGKTSLGFIGNIDDDTYVTTESYDVCLRATAAWIRAVDLAMGKERFSMALTRPPGHHATKSLSNGFCIFNFCAAAVIHATRKYSNMKISVFDWDVHYGQGVAEILQSFPNTRYVSIHQLYSFPYMGEKHDIFGQYQNIMTIPIVAETSFSCGYKQKFLETALPFLSTTGEWEPELVIVCAGYDALDSDEYASISLQASDFGRIAYLLRQHIPSAPIMFGLEGGYQLRPMAGGGNLPDAVLETVKALIEQ